MSKMPSSLVHQTATTTGTGNFTLVAVNGKRSFNTAFGNGAPTDVFDYFISHRAAAEWEIGTGHMSDATTLVRDTVVTSSNANAAVNFSAGTKDVTNDIPANENIFFADGTGIKSTETGNPDLLTFTSVASAAQSVTITNATTGGAEIGTNDGRLLFRPESGTMRLMGTLSASIRYGAEGDDQNTTVSINDQGYFFTSANFAADDHARLAFSGDPIEFITDFEGSAAWTIDQADGAGALVAGNGEFIQLNEVTAPSTGGANTVRIFARDNGGGKTQLCVIFQSGAVQVIATEV